MVQEGQKKKRLVDVFSAGVNHGGGLPRKVASMSQYAGYLLFGMTAFQAINMGLFTIPTTVGVMGATLPFTMALIGGVVAFDLAMLGLAMLSMPFGSHKFPALKMLANTTGFGGAKPTKDKPNPALKKVPLGGLAQAGIDAIFGNTGAETSLQKGVGMLGKMAGIGLALGGMQLGLMAAPHLAAIFTVYNPVMMGLFAASMGAMFVPMAATFAINYIFNKGKPIKTLGLGMAGGVAGVAATAYSTTTIGGMALGGMAAGAEAIGGAMGISGAGAGLTAAFSQATAGLMATADMMGLGLANLGVMTGNAAVAGWATGAGAFLASSPIMPVVLAGVAAFAAYKLARKIPGFRPSDRKKQAQGPAPGSAGTPATG